MTYTGGSFLLKIRLGNLYFGIMKGNLGNTKKHCTYLLCTYTDRQKYISILHVMLVQQADLKKNVIFMYEKRNYEIPIKHLQIHTYIGTYLRASHGK